MTTRTRRERDIRDAIADLLDERSQYPTVYQADAILAEFDVRKKEND